MYRVLDSRWTNTKKKGWSSTCSWCAGWPAGSSSSFRRCARASRVCRSTIRALSCGASTTSRPKSLKLESRRVSSSSRLLSTPASTDTNCRYVLSLSLCSALFFPVVAREPTKSSLNFSAFFSYTVKFFFVINNCFFVGVLVFCLVFRRHCSWMVTGREKELTSLFTSKSCRESTTPFSSGLSLTQFRSRSTTRPPIPTR